uniref:NADH-ubiquinone oxidoreductase chain 1 n=1 Tax=Tylosurus melanotus TaxID=3053213 RepID=A0A161HLM5_9TELE|nr:NADH dehydrogenase subunit 1 [Tylosurus acus melanotus]
MITSFWIFINNPLILMIFLLVAVALLTMVERKVMGYMQLRKGPNIVGPYRVLQPIAEGLKLLIKEPVRPSTSSPILLLVAPIMAHTLALTLWTPMPLPLQFADMTLGMVFILALSCLAVYSMVASGCASNSKYPHNGAVRAVAQTMWNEVSLGLILINIVILTPVFTIQTFPTTQDPTWLILPTWPLAAMWYISSLAETNRAPFELTEGESDLVSGFNVELGGGPFALFLLAEYANFLLMNTLTATLILGTTVLHTYPEVTSKSPMLKSAVLSVLIVWFRASFPRLPYDQVIHLIWKIIVPVSDGRDIWHLGLPITFPRLPPQI